MRRRTTPEAHAGLVYAGDTPVSDIELRRSTLYTIDGAHFVIRQRSVAQSTVLVAIDADHPCQCGGWARPDTATLVNTAEDVLDVAAECDDCGDFVLLVCREELLDCYLSDSTFLRDHADDPVPGEFAEILRWRVKQLQSEHAARCLARDLTPVTDETLRDLAGTGRTLRLDIAQNLIVRAGVDPTGEWVALWMEGGRECAVGCADNDASPSDQGPPLRWTARYDIPTPHPWANWCDACSMSAFTSPRVVAIENLIPGGNPPGWGKSGDEFAAALELRAEHYAYRERRAATRTHLGQRAASEHAYRRFLETMRRMPGSESYWSSHGRSDFDRLTGTDNGIRKRLALIEQWLTAQPVPVYDHAGSASVGPDVWGDKVWDLRRTGRRPAKWTVKLGYSDAPLGARLRAPTKIVLPPDVQTVLDDATRGLLGAPAWSVDMDI